jgi:hypothetical protein
MVMAESCREWRGELAAMALGNIEDEARLALQAHLDGCAACRGELAEISAVARVLPDADPAELGTTVEPPPALMERVLGRLAWARADEKRQRRRRIAVVAATAVIGVAAAVGLLVLGASIGTSDDPEQEVEFTVAPPGVDATARLTGADYGTHVELEVRGLDDDRWYWLWLTGADGDRVGAGTFQASGSHFTVEMTSALALDDTHRIWVTDDVSDDPEAVVLDALLADT